MRMLRSCSFALLAATLVSTTTISASALTVHMIATEAGQYGNFETTIGDLPILGDNDPTLGVIAYTGTLGPFFVDLVAKRFGGSSTGLSLSAIVDNSCLCIGGPHPDGTLDIFVSDNNLFIGDTGRSAGVPFNVSANSSLVSPAPGEFYGAGHSIVSTGYLSTLNEVLAYGTPDEQFLGTNVLPAGPAFGSESTNARPIVLEQKPFGLTLYAQVDGHGVSSFAATIAVVPLPAALPLLAVGLGGLVFIGRRKKKAA